MIVPCTPTNKTKKTRTCWAVRHCIFVLEGRIPKQVNIKGARKVQTKFIPRQNVQVRDIFVHFSGVCKRQASSPRRSIPRRESRGTLVWISLHEHRDCPADGHVPNSILLRSS